MFFIVPLTIPLLIVYAIFRHPRVSMPIIGAIVVAIVLSFVIAATPPVVLIVAMVSLGLASLWWLRIRLDDNRGRHSYVEQD